MIPSPIVTGSISVEDLADARVAPVAAEREPEVDRAQRRHRHRELHDRPGEDADRVGVDLVSPRNAGRRKISEPMITTFQTSGAIAGIVKCS